MYRIALDDGRVVDASLRGRLKQQQRTGDRVVIGDRVAVDEAEDGGFTIEAVEPRVRQIVRRNAGGRRPKVVAANVDRLVAVLACSEPEPRTDVIDRLLVIAESDGLEAALVLNKADLPGAPDVVAELGGLYRSVGYQVLAVSARTGEGIAGVESLLARGTSALVGPSGAGKSSLLNAIQPDLGLRTGELSSKLKRGRHTTVSSRILPLACGGRVADTPGFGDVGLWGIEPGVLHECFPEFRAHLGRCRFQDCAHLVEPECAVRGAVEAGTIPPTRYASYTVLMEEAAGQRSEA